MACLAHQEINDTKPRTTTLALQLQPDLYWVACYNGKLDRESKQ